MKNFLKIELIPERIYGLDILRALAIIFVLMSHGQFFLPEKLSFIQDYIILDGVSIFFVLSGFLIGNILIKMFESGKTKKKDLLNFWVRRWFRTLPCYFLVLICLIIIYSLSLDNFNLNLTGKYFIFSQNLFYPHPWFFPEAWSLSVEEWFYILTPLIIFLFIRLLKLKPKHAVLITALLIIIFTTGFKFYRYLNIPVETSLQWDLLFRKQVITRLDSIMHGVLTAYIFFYYKTFWIKNKNLLLIFGILLFISIKLISALSINTTGSLYNCVFSFSTYSLATFCVLPFFSSIKHGSGIFYKLFSYLSIISYSLYLVNLSVIQLFNTSIFNQIFPRTDTISTITIKYILFWIISILISIILYKYFEKPVMDLRDSKKIKEFFKKKL